MTTFIGCNGAQSKPGFQRHHIIPLEIVRKPYFRDIFDRVRWVGFNPNDFETNGMWLPATEELALQVNLAMHRGPHPQYSELVSDWISHLTRSRARHPEELNNLLLMLRDKLRNMLIRRPSHVHLNRNDPLRVRTGFLNIDDGVGKLWPELPQS